MSEVSAALQDIRKGDGTDTQPLLHLVEVIKSPDSTLLPQLLTLSPSLSEVFAWWDRGPGQHPQSAACFALLAALLKSVLAAHTQFQAQAVALCRKVAKERLHSVYSCLSRYSSVTARKNCLEFLVLLNCFGGSVTRILLDDFNFGNASLKQMLANPGPTHEDAVRFMLSFLCVPSLELKVKFMMMKNVFKIMTTRIRKDSVELKLELVKVLLEHVLNIAKIQKKVLCQFFAVPVLVKISYFWDESVSELQEQTDLFFRALFNRKTGLLFDSSAVDVLTGCSRNPVLLNFVKHASSNSKFYGDFLVDMVKICPEVSSSLISNMITKKSSDLSFVSDLCHVLQARDVDNLLSTVTSDITDKQIIDYLVPKSITDFLEKQMKTSVDPVVYPLLLVLTESASIAVQTFPDRQQIRDIAMFNLVDIAAVNSAGLLSSRLAGLLCRIDRFSLHQYKLEKLIGEKEGGLTEDDVQLLILTYPTALRCFVKAHRASVVTKVLEKSKQSKVLFRKILLAIDSDSECSLARAILESVVFDDHSGMEFYIKGEKHELVLQDEIAILVDKICDFSTTFGHDFLTIMRDGLESKECDLQLLGKAECESIALMIAFICNPRSDVNIERWEYNLGEKLLIRDSPVFFLGSAFAIDDELWFDLGDDFYSDIRSDPVLIENLCLLFEHFTSTLCKLQGDTKGLDTFHNFLELFDDELIEKLHSSPEDYEEATHIVARIVDKLIEGNYLFRQVEVLRCVIMKDLLSDKRVEAVVLNALISDDPFERGDEHFIPTIRNHLDKFAEFCCQRSYLPVKSIWFGLLHFFKLFHSNTELFDEYQTVWFLLFLGHDGKLCSEIFSRMPEEAADELFLKLYSESCREEIVKHLNFCEGSMKAAKHSRFQCILLLEKLLNSRHSKKKYDSIFSVSDYKGHEKEYQEHCEWIAQHESPGYDECRRECILSELICKTVPEAESEALFLVSEAIKLECTEFFTSIEFENVAALSNCLKSKKILKQIFELFVKKSDVCNFRTFLSLHVSVYEEHLPAFTRKQFDKIFCSTLELLDQAIAPETGSVSLDIVVELLTQLIITFQEIMPGDRLSAVFNSIINHPTAQKCLISEELSSRKTLLIKLFVSLLETGKVPSDILNTTHYLLFQTSYSATSSFVDKSILKILKHLEQQGVTSKYPFAYGAHVADLKSATNITLYNEHCIKILENMDSEMMKNLIDNFPLHSEESTKMLTDSSDSVTTSDPEYVLSLLLHVLGAGEVEVRMILSNPISRVMLLALSSYDEATRRVGYVCLDKTSRMIEEEKFKEKSMCLYLFNMIENSITSVEERLPHLSAYFLGVMLHSLFAPHKHVYQNICHFLLQRPVFDFHDVPLFYSMFCSSTLHYKQDQTWLLEILCVAVRDEIDYNILSRRHVLPVCFSQISCPNVDKRSAELIQNLLKKVFSIKSAKVHKDLSELGIIAIK